MKVLVINTGSSSIKYQLFDMAGEEVLAAGLLERIGEAEGRLTQRSRRSGTVLREARVADHGAGMAAIVDLLTDPEMGVVRYPGEIGGVGHRVVHGGEAFHRSTLVDAGVERAIREHVPLAPLHNPANLTGIEVARSLFPGVPQVAVFDTAFHQTIPEHAYLYALPYALYEEQRVRRYGFHGTSHRYVGRAAAAYLGREPEALRMVTVHLGNGASVAAIAGGRCIDTSMGLTPLEGLIMGTRSGDVDPALHAYLARQCGDTIEAIDRLLNKESGLKGICGRSDMRDILAQEEAGEPRARLAVAMYAYRIRKYIGAYLAALGGLDALVFTAGIGENSPPIRARVCQGLEGLGIALDPARNAGRARAAQRDHAALAIDDGRGPVRILVVPTDEELEIARETVEVIGAAWVEPA